MDKDSLKTGLRSNYTAGIEVARVGNGGTVQGWNAKLLIQKDLSDS